MNFELNVIKNAKFAKDLWEELDNDMKNKFKKYFHIRPSTSGFTIVSTHPEKPMNGIPEISKSNLKQGITKISDSINNETINWENSFIINKKNNKNNKNTFKTTYRSDKEYKIQSKFINKILCEDSELKNMLQVTKLYLVGSEIILPGRKEKIDVLAYGKTYNGTSKIFFIEIKKAGNELRDRKEKAFEQVKNYINVYFSSHDKDFKNLIENYPILGLEEQVNLNECECEGWVVKGNTEEEKMIKKDTNYIEIFQN